MQQPMEISEFPIAAYKDRAVEVLRIKIGGI
jgi:hypothetical protein